MRFLLLFAAMCVFGLSFSGFAQSTVATSDWQRVKQLPLHTKIHIASDKNGRTCSIDAVDEGSLTCSSGHTGTTFPRAEIKSVKVTRYVWSTVGGAAIGAGVGAVIGVAARGPSTGFGTLSNDVKIGIGAVAGGVGGAAAGGLTDMFRGPLVYQRPKH